MYGYGIVCGISKVPYPHIERYVVCWEVKISALPDLRGSAPLWNAESAVTNRQLSHLQTTRNTFCWNISVIVNCNAQFRFKRFRP